MLDRTLTSLHEAVNALDNEKSLSLLNINEDLLHSPTTTLEYVERCRSWKQLRNITNSIPDLLRQDDSVALVGFLGHFSSGKSSLINALLNVSHGDNPGYRREVGLHPTDTGITLITHRDHAELVRKSAFSAIDDLEVVHGPALPFLEHAALVDTPGLGNEAAELDIVTRFLHMCHVLVITIDGRRPFADKEKDFDLLDTAFNKLSGVPKILVITSAEEFLTSRQGSFENDWLQDKAEEFWQEAIQRLKADPRFHSHIYEFQKAPRFFVDSKEGFRVDEVSEAILPIVTDDAHRARIRQSQGQYVLSIAGDALEQLLRYIASRSDNLNRLEQEAQRRADNTATAAEKLLESLEVSFQKTKERLASTRQQIPNAGLPINNIVTAESIAQKHQKSLEKLESHIKKLLEQELTSKRKAIFRQVFRSYKARTRSWWRSDKDLQLEILSSKDSSVYSQRNKLAQVSIACAEDMIAQVEKQLTAVRINALRHLDGWLERREISYNIQEIESSLKDFERYHDDSVKAFFAYISAPSSSELLREHGFVGFDERGNQAIQTREIDVLKVDSFIEVVNSANVCKLSLKRIEEIEPEGFYDLADDNEVRHLEDAIFGDQYCSNVENQINNICTMKDVDFASNVNSKIIEISTKISAELEKRKKKIRRIWHARGTILARFSVIAILLALAAYILKLFVPEIFARLVQLLPENPLDATFVAVVPSLVVMFLVYIFSGAKNPGIRRALSSTLFIRWQHYVLVRQHKSVLRWFFDQTYGQLITGIQREPLEIDKMIVTCVIGWLQNKCESYKGAQAELTTLNEKIAARSMLLDEFTAVVNQKLAEIPNELREAADGIKTEAIEAHMTRIREAAAAVANIRKEIERIIEIANQKTVSV